MYKIILPYCLKSRKNTMRTKNGKITLLSKCEVSDTEKTTCIKKQQAKGLLSSLGINTPLNKIILLSPLLF